MRIWRDVVGGVLALAIVSTGGCALDVGSNDAERHALAVYVQDETGPRWPVSVAVRQWAAGLTRISLMYDTCPRRLVSHSVCITIREGGTFRDDEVGRTNGVRRVIRMNPAYSHQLSRSQRLAAVCHELGHALGLRHNEDTDSCMNAVIDDRTSSHPGRRDLERLND